MLSRLLAVGSLLPLLISCTTASPEAASSPPTGRTGPPNIIYILADDLGYGDLSCYGQEKFSTPNLDRLAAGGMRFTDHYSGSTVCAPSRSALMTGLHTGHTYIRGNKEVRPEGQHPLPATTVTLAEALKAAGYVTGAFGKWGLGFPGSEGDPVHQGFDVFYGYNCQRKGHHYYPRHLWSNRDSVTLDANAGTAKGTFAPDLIHAETMAFLEANKDTSFFLYVPSIIPHAELIAPDSVLARYRGRYLPETPYEGYDEGPKYRDGPYESQAEPHAAFVAMVDILDRQVGEIVRRVEELGIAENTLIIFTSDNGPHLEGGADPDYFDSNGPFRGHKRDLYEGGIRVPLIASWPGTIAAGTTSDHVSAFWDMYATLGAVAGAGVPPESDGISILPTLTGVGEQAVHDYLYWEFHERGGRQAVRKGDWKAVRYDVKKSPAAPVELYDLARDPGETTNVAAEHPAVAAEMALLMQTARTPSEVFSFGREADQGR